MKCFTLNISIIPRRKGILQVTKKLNYARVYFKSTRNSTFSSSSAIVVNIALLSPSYAYYLPPRTMYFVAPCL